MSIYAGDVKKMKLRKYSINDLSPEAARRGMSQVIDLEVNALSRGVKSVREYPDVHKFINSGAYRKLVSKRDLIRKLETDKRYLIKFIDENLCEFTEDGDVILYTRS